MQEVAVLRKMQFRVVPHTKFVRVWSSDDVPGAKNSAAAWVPDTEMGWLSSKFGRRKELICLGHYVTAGQRAPNRASSSSGETLVPKLLEVTDTGAMGMSGSQRHTAILDRLLPFPTRYHLAWSKVQGKRPLYVWRPAPPSSEFACLGQIFTSSPEQPPLNAMRCVPVHWLTRASGGSSSGSTTAPQLAWDDSGTAGRRGTLWTAGGLGLGQAMDGAVAPDDDDILEFVCESFLCTSDLRVMPQ